MNDTINEATRHQVASFLPAAINKALRSYHNFSDTHQPEGDVKAFTAHHTACKVAIAHVELLLKLARWADIGESGQEENLTLMLSQAEDEVRRYYNEAGDE